VCDRTGGLSVQNVGFAWANGQRGHLNDLLSWVDGDLLLLVFGDLSASTAQRLRQLAEHAPVRSVQVVGSDGWVQAREHVRDPQGHLQGACHVFGHAWALVRPDGYLAATGESVDSQLIRAVERALGIPHEGGQA
jgi:3-(3-hydroxy-phenyl)propionate hydroxylase